MKYYGQKTLVLDSISGSWSISFSLMMPLWSKVKKVIRAIGCVGGYRHERGR